MTASLPLRKYVIDANVLFGFLISGQQRYLSFLTDNRIFTTDFLLEELQFHQQVITQRTKLPPEQFDKFALSVFERITVVPNLLITTQSYY